MSIEIPPGYPDNKMLLKYIESQFNDVKDNLGGIKVHLQVLNGQVEKNTGFRNRSVGIYLGVSTTVGFIFTLLGLGISHFI